MSAICIAAQDFVHAVRPAPPVKLAKAATRPSPLTHVGMLLQMDLQVQCATLTPDRDRFIDIVAIKSPGLPIMLPPIYAFLTPLLQLVANHQGQDRTMPYTGTAAHLFIRRAFWPKDQPVTDYMGHMMDADTRLARGGRQARLICYSVHDAPALTLGFHAVALPAAKLLPIKAASKTASDETYKAVLDHCAARTPDMPQRAGDIIRRDELTAWGRNDTVMGDGQHHHFITVSFFLPNSPRGYSSTAWPQLRDCLSSSLG